MHVSILNYGVGNLYSLQAALKREGAEPQVITNIRRAKTADALLLPGVGSFREAARKLPRNEIREIVKGGKPLIGICLGLQRFFDNSEEGRGKGLGLFPGRTKRLPATVKVPQIGWNVLKIVGDTDLVEGISDNSWVYYVHSYYPETQGDWVAATSTYGVEYPTLIAQKNIFGAQFHPEKSGTTGRKLLQNFLQLVRK